MDDQFPKDENSARVDFDISPESGVAGQEPVKFNIKEQQDRFLGGSSGEPPEPKGGIILSRKLRLTMDKRKALIFKIKRFTFQI
jgi:hypothetical protein